MEEACKKSLGHSCIMLGMIDTKWTRTALVMLSVFLLFKSLGALKEWQAPVVAYSTIVVTGQGEVFATPDVASFSFSVSADDKSVGAAQDVVTGKIGAILDAMKDLGVKEADIRTMNYSVYPKYHYERGNAIPDGFTVSQSVMIKIRNTGDAGKALALAGSKGATNISSLALDVDDSKAVEADARDKAVSEARTKAKALAKSLGVSLGRVVDFNDGTGPTQPVPMYYAMEAAGSMTKATPEIPVGQSRFVSNVSITYEIR